MDRSHQPNMGNYSKERNVTSYLIKNNTTVLFQIENVLITNSDKNKYSAIKLLLAPESEQTFVTELTNLASRRYMNMRVSSFLNKKNQKLRYVESMPKYPRSAHNICYSES